MTTPLGRKVQNLREQYGWSIYAACEKMPTVGRESLRRIEEGRTDPLRLPLATVLEILELFYPELKLEDFTGDDPRFVRFVIGRRTTIPKKHRRRRR